MKNTEYLTRKAGPYVYSWNSESQTVSRQCPPLRSISVVGSAITAREAENVIHDDVRRQIDPVW